VQAQREIVFPSGALRLRSESVADDEFRFALFCVSRPPGEDFAPLGPEVAAKLLRQQFLAQSCGYRQDFPDARFLIVELDGAPVGRIVVARSEAEVRIVDLALLPDRRGGGIGEALMRAVIEEARAAGLPLRASVMTSNLASLRFCQRFGLAPRGGAATFYLELEKPAGRSP